MEEIWKDIKGTGGMYQISNTGKVISLWSGRPKLLKPVINYGYPRIFLTGKNGKNRRHYVHRLVYETHVGPIPEGMDVDHIDGRRANNVLSNLRILNRRDNVTAGFDRLRSSNKLLSKYAGVTPCRRGWAVQCHIEGKSMYVGWYECEQVARCVSELALEGVYPPRLQKRLYEEKKTNTNG